jgi:hypothetical protein
MSKELIMSDSSLRPHCSSPRNKGDLVGFHSSKRQNLDADMLRTADVLFFLWVGDFRKFGGGCEARGAFCTETVTTTPRDQPGD